MYRAAWRGLPARDVPTDVFVSLDVQDFAGTVVSVRFGTCRCIPYAGTAPSRAARACGVKLQVRNATQPGAAVRICTCRWIHGPLTPRPARHAGAGSRARHARCTLLR